MNTQKNTELIHQFETPDSGIPLFFFIGIVVVVVLLGVGTGFGVSTLTKKASNTPTSMNVQTDKAAGVSDKKTFKDSAEGVLKAGGLEGEGSFHLQRPGGASQNAYLTSSTVDLSIYEGKKVRVWGATFSGQKAAWLMDVGLVELLP